MKKYTIAVAGTGYVGLSIATLLAQHHKVYAVDIVPEKVRMINEKLSPIKDDYIEAYLEARELDLTATLDGAAAYAQADFVVIAAPTNYDPKKNYFDTSAVEAVIRMVMEVNPDAIMVIKSTIPVGFTKSIREKTGSRNILFSPEFLRESKALFDNLYPSRIIVGTDLDDPRLVEAANEFAGLLAQGAIKEEIDTLIMGYTEAEAVKLFANTYLALRVSFFNELDTYAEMRAGHPADHRRHLSRSPDRSALQQPQLRLRWLLSAQGHQAVAGQLSGCAGESDPGHRGQQPDPEGFHRGPGAGDRGLLCRERPL